MSTKTDLDLEAIDRLRLSVLRIARRVRQQSDTGLTPSQLSGLTTIDRRGPMRLGELARRERIGKSSVTRLVSRLEAEGHVQTVPDPDDGRGSVVCVTEQGRQLLGHSARRVDAYLARQVSGLTEEQRETLFSAIPVLEELLEVRA